LGKFKLAYRLGLCTHRYDTTDGQRDAFSCLRLQMPLDMSHKATSNTWLRANVHAVPVYLYKFHSTNCTIRTHGHCIQSSNAHRNFYLAYYRSTTVPSNDTPHATWIYRMAQNS